ncbi:MAG TPA: DUF4349 domain-containing protein [Saprospiraceae bacterium]|nr:DUF4349 domain-containing protein [Saprospiraceae bacterium]
MRYFFVLFALLFIGCSQEKSDSYEEVSATSMGLITENEKSESEVSSDHSAPIVPGKPATVLKILKSGQIGFEVTDLQKSKKSLDTLVEVMGGYLQNEELNTYGSSNTLQLSIRIPAARFDDFIKAMEAKEGQMISKSIQANDVSEEYHDLELRLKSSEAYLSQYRTLLTKAESIKDLMEIQEKIRGIETEMDVQKGRLLFLNDRVSMSVLDVELRQYVRHAGGKTNFGTRLWNAVSNGFEAGLDILVLLVTIWPVWIFVLGLFGFWKMRKRKKIVAGEMQ